MQPSTPASQAFADAFLSEAWGPDSLPPSVGASAAATSSKLPKAPIARAPAVVRDAVEVFAPPPPRPPADPEAEKATSRWQSVHILEPTELHALLLEHDGDPPSEHLAAVCQRIEAITGLKAPSQLAQRRVHISDWVISVSLASRPSRAPSVPGTPPLPSSSGPALPPCSTPPSASAVASVPSTPRSGPSTPRAGPLATALAGGALASAAASALASPPPTGHADDISDDELALAMRVGAMRDGNGRLHVPAEALPSVLSEVLLRTGRLKSPPSLSVRRRLIEDWYVSVTERLERQRARQPHAAAAAAAAVPSDEYRCQGLGAVVSTGMQAGHQWQSRDEYRCQDLSLGDAYPPSPPQPLPPPRLAPPPPPPAAASFGAAGFRGMDLERLFAHLSALEVERPQPQELIELGALARRVVLSGAELADAVRRLSDATGAMPAGSSIEQLTDFVSDWYRWHVHLQRGGYAPVVPVRHTHQSTHQSALSSALSSVPQLQLPPPSLPHSLPLLPPAYHERSLDALPSPRPSTVPPSGAEVGTSFRQGDLSARSHRSPAGLTAGLQHVFEEQLTEEQIITELHASLPPADAAAFERAALTSAPFEPDLQLPTARLAALAKHIEAISGRKVPQLQKLKRDYVVSWWRQTAARRLHMATLHSPRAPVPSAVPSAAPGGSTSPRLEYPPPPNKSLLFASRAYADYPPPTSPATAGTPRGVGESSVPNLGELSAFALPPLSGAQCAQLRRLLGHYGAPDPGTDGGPELRVPVEMLQVVCSQVETVTGEKPPRLPRARREWLAALAAAALQG